MMHEALAAYSDVMVAMRVEPHVRTGLINSALEHVSGRDQGYLTLTFKYITRYFFGGKEQI